MSDREQTVEDEFVRAKPRGIRLFSPGLFTLARKLGVHRALPKGDARAAADPERDSLILTWLMDERHSEDAIREFADAGRAAAEAAMRGYEMAVSVVFVAACQREVERTEQAIAALSYKIEPKPKEGGGPQPLGK